MIIITAMSIRCFHYKSVVQKEIQLYRLPLHQTLLCSQLPLNRPYMTHTQACPFEACILSLVMI